MKELFRNPTYVRLFLASCASQLGTTVGNMAFAFYLLDRFASKPFYATLAEMMYSLPTLFVFFIVGVAADRFDRQRIASYSNWIRAGLTVALFGAITLSFLPLVFAILFLRSAVAKFFQPAELALVQGILRSEQYGQAEGLNQMVFGVFMLFGVSLGALAYQTVGIQGAIAVDGVSFLLSGLLIFSCRMSEDVRRPNGPARIADLRLSQMFADFKEGLVYTINNRLLLTVVSGFFIFGFINGGFAVLPMFTLKYKLAPDAYQQYTSLLAICLGLGFLIGSGIGTVLIKKVKPHLILIGGLFVSALLTAVLGQSGSTWLFLTLVFVLGMTLAPVNIAIGGWMPQIVDKTKMGRVSAWIDPLMMLAQSVSLGLIALLFPKAVSIEALYLIMGGCIFAAFAWYFLMLPRLVRQAEAADMAQAGTAASEGTISA